MIFWTLLAAKIDLGEWLKLLMAAGVFVIYIINYLINESKQNRKRQLQQQQRKQAQAATLQRPGEPSPVAQGAPNDEIEEFLRRAAQQRKEGPRPKEQPSRPQPGARRPFPPREQRPPAPKQAQRVTQPQMPVRRLVDRPAEAELEVVNPSQSSESLSDQVARRFSTDEFAARAAHLTDDIARADVERELHLKKMFGHQVGNLQTEKPLPSDEKMTSTAPSVVGQAAGGLGGLLHGDSLRYAIILNEILGRPEDRWPDDRW
jgi:hypothetical protein